MNNEINSENDCLFSIVSDDNSPLIPTLENNNNNITMTNTRKPRTKIATGIINRFIENITSGKTSQ